MHITDFVTNLNNSHWLAIVTFLVQPVLVMKDATMKHEKGTVWYKNDLLKEVISVGTFHNFNNHPLIKCIRFLHI